MLGTAVGRGGAVLLDREVHKSVCYGCALLGITPYFFSAPLIEPFAVSGALPVKDAEAQLIAHPEIKAILLTSPTYYGIRRAIPEFADLCRAHGKLLLVDGAHGAHFPAVGCRRRSRKVRIWPCSPCTKTLPCMGQGAVLLSAAGVDRRALRENTMLFGTSSPSYPIMASIDLARAYTEGPGHAEYCARRKPAPNCVPMCSTTMFTALTEDHFPALDPCRLTVCTAGTDITGHQLADTLWSECGVACEMADDRNVVFILTGSDPNGAISRLKRGLRRISRRRELIPLPSLSAPFPPAERVMSVRDAWFSQTGRVQPAAAEGLVCARPVTPYPPGVPLLWPGEKIQERTLHLSVKDGTIQ